MAATLPDVAALCRLMNLPEAAGKPLFISRCYADPAHAAGGTLVGPFIGAPYAAMLLETLAVRGATKFVLLGWCGAVSPQVHIGDIVVPTAALIDEGTSAHYLGSDKSESVPADSMLTSVTEVLARRQVPFHAGTVWSTDGIYRETREKVQRFQAQQVLAVDMETSALFTVGRFRKLQIAALLVVSDELSSFRWLPGFKQERFKSGRAAACKVVHDLWQVLAIPR